MYIKRSVKEIFNKVADVYNIVALVGARQSGKTTFLKEHIKGKKSSYVLFDDPDARALFEEDIKKFEKQYIDGYDISVLDEIQYCKNAGSSLKYLADKGSKLWVTSSSEILLGKNVLSYLVGRVSIIKLYPFSIHEFLFLNGQKTTNPTILKRLIWEHMTYGGYPKVTITNDIEVKKIILKDLYETMILKDVARTFSISDINTLEMMVKYISINIGNLISYHNISRDLDISFQTIKKYLEAMEKSYIIVTIPPFYKNKSREIVKQPKIYFLDTGLRNIVAKTFMSEPDGKLFENYIVSELLKLGFSPKHWRTKSKAEVDFVVEKENNIIPIEVKLNTKKSKIGRSMRSFIETYKPEKAIIVSYKGENRKAKIGNCTVFFTDAFSMKNLLQ